MVPSYSYTSAIQHPSQSRDGILGHQFNKRVESFAPSYTQSFYWRIWKKTILYFGFNNPYKNPQNSSPLMNICRTEKWGNKTRQKLESEKTRVYVQEPRLKIPFKNSISMPIHFDNDIIKVIYPAYLNLLRMWGKYAKVNLTVSKSYAPFL